MAMPYNYARFRLRYRGLGQLDGVQVGEPAPDLDAIALDGTPVKLSGYRGQPVVLETGSMTCPMYAGRVEPMNQLAARYPDVRFLVLYTREAHPGERIGPHHSMEQKLANAHRLTETDGERRTVLVDDLNGTGHQRYGFMPNSVHVITADGTVAYRAVWNEPDAVEEVLRRLRAGDDPSTVPAPFRPVPIPTAIRVFARGGRRALIDAAKALPDIARMRRH